MERCDGLDAITQLIRQLVALGCKAKGNIAGVSITGGIFNPLAINRPFAEVEVSMTVGRGSEEIHLVRSVALIIFDAPMSLSVALSFNLP